MRRVLTAWRACSKRTFGHTWFECRGLKVARRERQLSDRNLRRSLDLHRRGRRPRDAGIAEELLGERKRLLLDGHRGGIAAAAVPARQPQPQPHPVAVVALRASTAGKVLGEVAGPVETLVLLAAAKGALDRDPHVGLPVVLVAVLLGLELLAAAGVVALELVARNGLVVQTERVVRARARLARADPDRGPGSDRRGDSEDRRGIPRGHCLLVGQHVCKVKAPARDRRGDLGLGGVVEEVIVGQETVGALEEGKIELILRVVGDCGCGVSRVCALEEGGIELWVVGDCGCGVIMLVTSARRAELRPGVDVPRRMTGSLEC